MTELLENMVMEGEACLVYACWLANRDLSVKSRRREISQWMRWGYTQDLFPSHFLKASLLQRYIHGEIEDMRLWYIQLFTSDININWKNILANESYIYIYIYIYRYRYISEDYIGLRLYTCMDSRTFLLRTLVRKKTVFKAPTWKRNLNMISSS